MTPDITSPANPRVKATVALRNRRQRRQTGLFLVEGTVEVRRGIAAGVDFDEIFVSVSAGEAIRNELAAATPVTVVSDDVFAKLAFRQSPDGVLGVAHTPQPTLADLPFGSLYLVVERVEKPGNLGTMLRTADAVGADGVVVCDEATDLFGPNVVRASLGCLFTVPVAVASTEAAIAWCRDRGLTIIATTPAGETLHHDVALAGPVAIAIGAEHAGLTDRWLEAADHRIRLPMHGAIDSLNAATAAAVVLYEAVRQRSVTNRPGSVGGDA